MASCVLEDGSVVTIFREGVSVVLPELTDPGNVKMFDKNSAIAYRICDGVYISQRIDKHTGETTTLLSETVGPQGNEDDGCRY